MHIIRNTEWLYYTHGIVGLDEEQIYHEENGKLLNDYFEREYPNIAKYQVNP